jgi:hypothetical protein
MSKGRVALLGLLAAQLGSGLLLVDNVRDGWPALCRIRVDAEWLPIGVHIGSIGLSGRGRDDVERRAMPARSRVSPEWH